MSAQCSGYRNVQPGLQFEEIFLVTLQLVLKKRSQLQRYDFC